MVATFTLVATLAGCLTDDGTDADDDVRLALPAIDTGMCVEETDGPAPPPGEEVVGLRPIQMIFGGSIRHADTRVLLVPPTHGDLGSPTNSSRSGDAYLQATLAGMYAWEPAIDIFTEKYPEFEYLQNITVHVEVFDEPQTDKVGYDIVVGYVETSGPAFRGVAIDPGVDIQEQLDSAGIGDMASYGNRYILLSLFAYSERAGQTEPDFPETHEMRGVMMHEFAHTWGLGHSNTWTPGCGGDLMNSPYPYIYGDGDPLGDGGERTKPLCISSLDLYGLAHLYRWLPNGSWQGTGGEVEIPQDMVYEEYCEVHDEAEARAAAQLERVGRIPV